MSNYFETVRFNIKYYREIHGISQAKLAELANCSNGLIGLIESGKAKPSFDTLTAIAESLSVHPADLFLRDCSKSKSEIKDVIEKVLVNDIQKILDEHF
ncbi:MAG: helix-turn-helix transcriptional regulator [Treponema sp.]|nr:helix-turn-helix transcriptional regulator [Spirochaetia bacterium]MDY4210575.1 helix-turn-helix transcriptional regulator [Treponema sp.]